MQYKINFDKILDYVKEYKIETVMGIFFIISILSIISIFSQRQDIKNSVQQNVQQQTTTADSQQSATNPIPTNIPEKPNLFDQIAAIFGLRSKSTPKSIQVIVSSEQIIPAGYNNVSNNSSPQQVDNPIINNPTGSPNVLNSGGTNAGESQTGQNNSGSGGAGSGGTTGSSQQIIYPTLPPVTDVKIVFIDSNGTYETYVPPNVPPIDVTWMLYINHQDHYSIEYPSDWLIMKSNFNGHEGITLYMPGGDPKDIDKPSIAFVGWPVDYLTSSANYTGRITLKGVPGTIYTNGPLGISTIAAVFQPGNNYFAIGSSTSNSVFIYVFDHMLRSLDFNIQ